MKATLVAYIDFPAKTPALWYQLAAEIIGCIERHCDYDGDPITVIHAETLDHGDIDQEDRP